MNGYERVVAALNREVPDRIPLLEWVIHPNVIEGLCPGCTYYDLVEKLDLDAVSVRGRHRPDVVAGGQNFYTDHWGTRWQRTAEAWGPIEGPIKSMADLRKYKAPDPRDPVHIEGVRKAVERFKGKKFIICTIRAEFMTSVEIRGMTGFLTDLIDNPDLARAVLQVVSDHYCVLAPELIKAGADGIMFGDDWAYNSGPFMSPRQFKEFILPYFKRAVDAVHDAGGYVVKHCDGNIWPIIDMVVNAGPDGLNPLQPDAGMDLGEVKAKYGDRICLLGNVNCGYTLSEAPVSQVIRETKEAIRKGGPGGGYIMTSSNSLHSSVKPENYQAMVETTKKYGTYPLDMTALK